MIASSSSISLAQLGQRGARSRSVTSYGLPSSSRSSECCLALAEAGFLAAGADLAGALAGFAGAALAGVGAALTGTTAPQPLQRIFFPSSSAGAFISFLHSGQVMTRGAAMMLRLLRPR